MAGPQSECAVSATMVRVEYKREVAAGNPDAVKPAHGPRGADAEESMKAKKKRRRAAQMAAKRAEAEAEAEPYAGAIVATSPSPPRPLA